MRTGSAVEASRPGPSFVVIAMFRKKLFNGSSIIRPYCETNLAFEFGIPPPQDDGDTGIFQVVIKEITLPVVKNCWRSFQGKPDFLQ